MELQSFAVTRVLADDLSHKVFPAQFIRVSLDLEVDIVFLHTSFAGSVQVDVADVFDLDLYLALGRAERASLDVDPVVRKFRKFVSICFRD